MKKSKVLTLLFVAAFFSSTSLEGYSRDRETYSRFSRAKDREHGAFGFGKIGEDGEDGQKGENGQDGGHGGNGGSSDSEEGGNGGNGGDAD